MPLTARDHEKIGDVVAILREVESILFSTGAGISADSGLPTYRGIGGLYNDAATDEGHPYRGRAVRGYDAHPPAYHLEVSPANRESVPWGAVQPCP